MGFETIPDPRFHHHGFYVAPYYRKVYPSVHSYARPFAHDPHYHAHYYSYWRTVDLPTTRMRELALPEGVVEPGGSVSGWMYFERVDPDDRSATFRMDLVDAESAREIGMITIPFAVEKTVG